MFFGLIYHVRNNFSLLQDKKKLVMQAMQCMNWNDPRLSWTRGQPRISLPASVIWIPDIVLYGQ